jgi:2-C-methyl-D-erythritol 2,4-cyclodiphosphate synthase
MTIGIGYDAHKISKKGKMALGGITIDEMKAFDAHSGAASSSTDKLHSNIGEYFNSNNTEKNIDSKILLDKIITNVYAYSELSIVNIDITVIGKKPFIQNYKDIMLKVLSTLLKIRKKQINIKGKSNNGIDSNGKGHSLSCITVIQMQ